MITDACGLMDGPLSGSDTMMNAVPGARAAPGWEASSTGLCSQRSLCTSAMPSPAPHHPFCTPLFIHPLTACLFFKQDKSKGIRAGCKLLFSYSAPCQVLRCWVVHHAMQFMHNLIHGKAWLKLEESMQQQGILGKHSLSASLEKALLSCKLRQLFMLKQHHQTLGS